jgi:hypothetical protein
VDRVAVPPLSVAVPKIPLRLSLNTTVPVGLTLGPPGTGKAVTVAVNVTEVPAVDGFELELRVTWFAAVLRSVVRLA